LKLGEFIWFFGWGLLGGLHEKRYFEKENLSRSETEVKLCA